MIITTSYRKNPLILEKVYELANKYNLRYVPRNKNTLKQLIKRHQCPVILVTDKHIRYVTEHSEIFFHPNFAQVRSKRIDDHQPDALIEVSGLKYGMSILDCTLGLGSDSLIASQVVGDKGTVIALESNPIMHLITSEGLRYYPFLSKLLSDAAKRIEIHHQHAYEYLKSLDDDTFDVVYFDPMFDSNIKEETPLNDVKKIADYHALDKQTISEAERVAKKCVIMKNHYLSDTFKELGFIQQVRKTSQFHYGVIKINEQ